MPCPPLQAKECMLFAGTGIASGAAVGLVNSIGMRTEIGKIQTQIQVVQLWLAARMHGQGIGAKAGIDAICHTSWGRSVMLFLRSCG
jgi:magnesium-transporting ATPase (P-type)